MLKILARRSMLVRLVGCYSAAATSSSHDVDDDDDDELRNKEE